MILTLYILIALSLVFDFLNGFHDSSNIVATVIASGALRPRVALYLTALAEFIAPFLLGVAVATTVGSDLIQTDAITIEVVIAAIFAAVLWNIFTWLLGIPSSSSHALVGGLLGTTVLAEGLGVVQMDGLIKILVALLISPVLGLVVGFLLMRLVIALSASASPKVNSLFKRLQIITSLGLALSHGSNDSQKTMGIITLGLVTAGFQNSFHVPLWVVAISAGAIALGTAFGGWRLIRTLGGRIYRIRPVHGFTAQAASASVILVAALLGGPVSTTQVVSSAIMGVGAAERVNKVRWLVGKEMLTAWVLTIPLTAGVAAIVYSLLIRFA